MDNVVITDQLKLGEPWRSRLLIYINTLVEGDLGSAHLPMLEGGTTPIVARYLQQAIRLGFLADETALAAISQKGEVPEGKLNKFIGGEKLGNAVAVNVFAYADNFLIGQKVISEEKIRFTENGNKILVIEDVQTHKRREIEVKTAVRLTGPGNEYLPIYDEQTQRDYALSNIQVDEYIQNVKDQLGRNEKIKLPQLPRILTLTSMEKMFRLWVTDLKRDPDSYPFAPLFDDKKRMAVIGGGDTGKVINEFLGRVSPHEAS